MTQSDPENDVPDTELRLLTQTIYESQFAALVRATHSQHGGGAGAARYSFLMREARSRAEDMLRDLGRS